MCCTFLTLLIKLHLKRISRGALFFLRFVWWGYMMGFITLKQQNSWILNRELSMGDNNTSVFMSLVSLCSVSNSVNRCVIELPVQLPAVTGGRPGAWMSMISYVSTLLNCNHKIRSSIRWMQYVVFSNMDSCEPKLIFSQEAKNKNRASRFFPDNKSNVFHVLHLCLCICCGLRRAEVCGSNRVPALPPICILLFHRLLHIL